MRGAALLLLAMLAACAPVPRPTSDPLIYEPAAFAAADHLVIGIPGAFSPVRVMAPLDRLAGPTRAVAFYRLPGFDDRPAEEFVNLDHAADTIVNTVRQGGFARVDLVGHSTGSAIALEAAKALRTRLPQVKVRVAAISTALPAPQPVLAGVRDQPQPVGQRWNRERLALRAGDRAKHQCRGERDQRQLARWQTIGGRGPRE